MIAASTSSRDSVSGATKAGNADHDDLGIDLGRAHLSQSELLGLTVAGFIPAVGMATLPAFVATYAGMSTWLPLLAATVTFIILALFVNVFTRRYVGTGSLFSFIRHAFGPWAGLLMAGALVPGYVIAVSVLLLGNGLYFGSFLISLGFKNASGYVCQAVISIISVLVTFAIVYRGIDVSVRASVVLTLISFPLVLLITCAVLLVGDINLPGQFSLEGLSPDGFLQGMAIGCSFYIAFESSAALGAETLNPTRVIPKAMLVVPLGLGSVYSIAAFIQVPTLVAHADQLALGVSPPVVLARSVGLAYLSVAVDLVLSVSIFASLIAFTNYGARVIAAVANQGLLPRQLLSIHPRYQSPIAAIVALLLPAAIGPILLLVFSDTTPLDLYGIIATVYVYAWVPPYILVCAGAARVLWLSGNSNIGIWVVAILTSVVILALYLIGIVSPGPAPLSAMPYVIAVTLVLVVAGFRFAWVRKGKKARDL